MAARIKKPYPAIKHGGYSATSILPGESAAAFERLHLKLIAEWTPNGPLEDDIISDIAHALWRKRNLAIFQIAERAQRRARQIRDTALPAPDGCLTKTDNVSELDRNFTEKLRAAERQAREELGELYALVEMGEGVTMDQLVTELEVQDRLDARIDRLIKRLLMVRGLKSMSIEPAPVSAQRLAISSRTG